MEGTRLTLQSVPPEGFEYSIRTPGTPARSEDYSGELDEIWKLLTTEIRNENRDIDKYVCDMLTRLTMSDLTFVSIRISDLILSLVFYWYNYLPLSRGAAATGE